MQSDASTAYLLNPSSTTPVDDIDLLIAGVAMANNLVLITHNQKHFGKVQGLELADWTI